MARFLLVRHAEPVSGEPMAGLTERGVAQAEALARRLSDWRVDAAWCSDLVRARQTASTLLRDWSGLTPRVAPALREVEPPASVKSGGTASPEYAAWERATVAAVAAGLSRWLRGVLNHGGTETTERDESTMGTGRREDGVTGRFPLPLGEAWTGQRAGGRDEGAPRPEVGAGSPRPGRDVDPRLRGDDEVGGVDDVDRNGDDGEGATYHSSPITHHSSLITHHSTLLVVSHAGPLRVLLCLLLGLPPEQHWAFHLDHAGLTVVERGDDMGTLMLLNDRCHLEEPHFAPRTSHSHAPRTSHPQSRRSP